MSRTINETVHEDSRRKDTLRYYQKHIKKEKGSENLVHYVAKTRCRQQKILKFYFQLESYDGAANKNKFKN